MFPVIIGKSGKLVTHEKCLIHVVLAPFSWKYMRPTELKMFGE